MEILGWRAWGGDNLVESMENVKSLFEDIMGWKAWGEKSTGWRACDGEPGMESLKNDICRCGEGGGRG